MQERRKSELEGYRKGEIRDWIVAGRKKLRTVGKQERRNSVLDGYMKGEIRAFRDSEKEKFGNGGKQERRISGLGDSGKEKYRKGEIRD